MLHWGGVNGVLRVKTRHAAQHPAMQRAPPHNMKACPVLRGAKVERSCFREVLASCLLFYPSRRGERRTQILRHNIWEFDHEAAGGDRNPPGLPRVVAEVEVEMMELVEEAEIV